MYVAGFRHSFQGVIKKQYLYKLINSRLKNKDAPTPTITGICNGVMVSSPAIELGIFENRIFTIYI